MSILEHNGSSVIAMVGKNCVAIASDLRFGVGSQTVAMDFPKVYHINDKLFIGLPGLLTDSITVAERMRHRVNLYNLREGREMSPKVVSNVISSVLYGRRFGPYFVEPIIAGLDSNNKPFISGQDLIGAPVYAEDFVLAGTATDAMFGMAESLWRKDLEPDELFEVISQALLNAVDRDASSGWGAIVHVMTPDKLITKTLKTRQD